MLLRSLKVAVLSALVLLAAAPASAASPSPAPPGRAENPAIGPGHPQRIVRPSDQLPLPPRGAQPAGAAAANAPAAPFLTRPYWDPHSVTSIFDHCNPDYTHDGRICEEDGTVALSSNGVDPTFTAGYALTPGGANYLYYDGHNGWDLGLSYEPILAAADGTVNLAGYDPYNPGFGNTITIDHPNGFTTRYAHLSQVWVSPGQYVTRGMQIGVSGNTGNSTGPHLHFGVYVTSSWSAIDPWGWTGASADPNPADSGNLWFTGNPHNPIPDAPTGAAASVLGTTATVSWTPPAFDGGSGLVRYTITASGGGPSVTASGTATSVQVPGLLIGSSYTFTVTATGPVGDGPASAPSNSVTATAANSYLFPWYDNRTAGMSSDVVHIVNPGQTAATGAVSLPGLPALQVSVGAGQEGTYSFPPGTIGGPLMVTTSVPVVASQRVIYGQSFVETTSRPAARASTTLWANWYDNASPGMVTDFVHLVNPSGAPVDATLALGAGVTPLKVTVPAGADSPVSFPPNTIGGPLKITASAPLLATQRVQYAGTFSETWAQAPAEAATKLYMNWYDSYSPGMAIDNVHIVNPDASATATGTIAIPGSTLPFSVGPGAEWWGHFPQAAIGGPLQITVTSGPGVLASQRVQYYGSFNEAPARSGADASARSFLAWYDTATPGMTTDNIHIVNPGATAATGTVTVQGRSLPFTVAAGAEWWGNLGPGLTGGPVQIQVTGGPAVLASQRIRYYQSFNEVGSTSG